MAKSIDGYHNLQVAPYQLKELVELTIEKNINQHTRMYFTGILPEELKDSYIDRTKPETQVEISLNGDEGKTLFKGIVLNVEIKAVRDVYYIQAEAISNTYTLDVAIKSRSFQDKGMTYESLIKQVVSGYSGDFQDKASKGKSIEKFTMQYKETDWEFIKRMASRFNAGLVPDNTSDSPKFYFGNPGGAAQKTLDQYHYSVKKKLSEFRHSSQNHIKGISESDFTFYEVETDEIMEIGCKVDFKGKSLYVFSAVTQMKNGILKHLYTLTPEKGLSQNNIYNEKITGLSLEGEVIEVSKDNLKVQLEIDEKPNTKDWLFAYSSGYTAEGNSGWYCMPEKGDHVLVHFPDNKEENGIATSSVRKDSEKGSSNKVDDPDKKYFRTKDGKELHFSPKEVLISAKDGEIFIKMDEDGGIEIISNKPVLVKTSEDLTMQADKNIVIGAGQSINLTCKDSSIKMDGDVHLFGKEVKTN